MRNLRAFPQWQRAFSLVELMVVLAVGSLLGLGLVDVLINSSQTYRMQNAMMRVQEQGQFAIDSLVKDTRDTGFWGCVRQLSDVSNHLNPLGAGYSTNLLGFTAVLEGQQDMASSPYVTGSDTITIRAARNISSGAQLRSPYPTTTTSPISITPTTQVTLGTIAIVSDCLQGDIFQVTNSDTGSTGVLQHAVGIGSPGNTSAAFSKVYANDAFVYLPYTHTYSVRTNAEGNPGLYLTDETGTTQEIVEGIENMVILYGEDTTGDGTADRYVRAGSVANMDDVVSIRINLIARSVENNVTDTVVPYVFNEQTITPADRRLRIVYVTTVVLRNRIS